GSAARLAGWEQISTSEEDLEEGKKKKNNEVYPKQKISIIHNTELNADTIEETTPIILHKCKSICKAKISNINEINIKSLINQNELLRQDDVNLLKYVNKEEINEKKSTRSTLLGSRQSGKTTLIKQFIHCINPGNPLPTCKHPEYYDPMISFNDRIYYVRLIDCPPIDKKFPTNSIEEWENYRGWGLRNASAFILVFDVNSESSFQHIRHLRDQIVSEFNDIPLLLVANKIDLLQQITNGFNSNNIIPSFYSTSSTSSSAITMPIQGQLQMIHLNNPNYRFNIRRDINMIIKKQWKRTILVECSAKYNWHVMNVFKELMRILENREQAHKPTAARAVQNALRNNQCSIM
ncbi:unnamed protein product, partial [Schistosoma mattheei]